jgi:hypothetical protein
MSDDFVKIGSHTLSPRPSKEELTFPEDESKLGLYWFHMYWNKYHDCVELEARVKELETRLQDLDNEMLNAFHSVGWYLKQHGADQYGEYDIHEVSYNNSQYEEPDETDYACAFIKICERLRYEEQAEGREVEG